jgi:hypothetical protein
VSSPPTLVLPNDDERTIVDSSRPEAQKAFVPVGTKMSQSSAGCQHPPSFRWRGLVSVGILAASLIILVFAANQQRRQHARLLQTIQVLQRDHHTPSEANGSVTVGSMPMSSNAVVEALRELPNEHVASRADLELEAAGFLLANDFDSALESYRRLSRRFPDDRVFADVITILRAKLGCSARGGVPGAACD